jgi:hypothetical protein
MQAIDCPLVILDAWDAHGKKGAVMENPILLSHSPEMCQEWDGAFFEVINIK